MKRSVQMKNAGIPKAKSQTVKIVMRNKHWRETRTIIGRHENGLPIIKYTPEPIHVIRPGWHARREAEKREQEAA